MDIFEDAKIEETEIIETEDTSSGEEITIPFSPSDISLSTPPMNMGDLIDRIQYRWINFGTEYQRSANLWSEEKQSRLIESILLGLRLPAFYFEEVSKDNWKIIDGLQRCSTIKNYCVDNSFSLDHLEFLAPKFKGKKYSELSFETIRDIRMLPVTVNVLHAGTPDRVKYILFKRLNTGGVELTTQEIRNAMFQGKAIDIVNKLAKNPSFKKATDPRMPVKRMQPQDFVSRFIAFYLQDYHSYLPDLDSFINTSMERLRDSLDDEQTNKMEKDFIAAMELANDIYGSDAFRKRDDFSSPRRPLNRAYFEVISTTFAKLSESDRNELLNKKDLLINNSVVLMQQSKAYNNSFSGGTGQKDSVIRRFSFYEEIVKRSLLGYEIRVNHDNKIENI